MSSIIPKWDPIPLSSHSPFSSPQPLTTTNLSFLTYCGYLHKWSHLTCGLLIWLAFIQHDVLKVTCSMYQYFLLWLDNIFHHHNDIFPTFCLSIDQLMRFKVLPHLVMDIAAVKFYVQVSVWTCFQFSGVYSGIAMSNNCFCFWGTAKLFSRKTTIFSFPPAMWGLQFLHILAG